MKPAAGILCAATVALAGHLVIAAPVPLKTVFLHNTFIDKYKDRALITDAALRVDFVPDDPHDIDKSGDDGDIHAAGRPGKEIGLQTVVEIVNARLVKSAMTDLQNHRGGKVLPVAGAWRLWLEHPSAKPQRQGATVHIDPKKTSNPDHVFEIHPLTRVGSQSILDESWQNIKGFTAYAADVAFPYYESDNARIIVNRGPAFTSVSGKKAKYNYAAFEVELLGAAHKLNDEGFWYLARVFGKSGKNLVKTPRRMIFVDGTDVATAAKPNAKLKVLGIPRFDLNRVAKESTAKPGADRPLVGAYEMIIVALIP